jgi:predicted MPP superfamily phosphohydrolase
MLSTFLLRLFLLLIFVGATIYAPWMLARLFNLQRVKSLYILFAIGTVSLPVSMGLLNKISSQFIDIYYLLSSAWIGFFLYLLLFLIIYQLINLFVKIPSKPAGITIIFLTLLVSLYALWNAYLFKVVHIDIPIKGLREELKIVLLADIHLGAHRKRGYLEKIVKETNRLQPDLILIPGDIVDSNTALDETLLLPLKEFQVPAYFVTGNHDTYVETSKLLKILNKNNVTILHNQVVKTNHLQLIGLDYMKADEKVFDMHPSSEQQTVKGVLPTLEVSLEYPTILMHHSPIGIQYISKRGIDLVLAGHTHAGGQIFPFTLLGSFFYPFKNGLYNYKGTFIYVSQGAGTYGPPMRLGTTNEITLIRLRKK